MPVRNDFAVSCLIRYLLLLAVDVSLIATEGRLQRRLMCQSLERYLQYCLRREIDEVPAHQVQAGRQTVRVGLGIR
jgi:hypothetical protein